MDVSKLDFADWVFVLGAVLSKIRWQLAFLRCLQLFFVQMSSLDDPDDAAKRCTYFLYGEGALLVPRAQRGKASESSVYKFMIQCFSFYLVYT